MWSLYHGLNHWIAIITDPTKEEILLSLSLSRSILVLLSFVWFSLTISMKVFNVIIMITNNDFPFYVRVSVVISDFLFCDIFQKRAYYDYHFLKWACSESLFIHCRWSSLRLHFHWHPSQLERSSFFNLALALKAVQSCAKMGRIR